MTGDDDLIEELASNIAVGVHTGLRKGSDAPSSGPLWKAISDSNDSAWMDAATFCADGLISMGLTRRDPLMSQAVALLTVLSAMPEAELHNHEHAYVFGAETMNAIKVWLAEVEARTP